MVEYRHSAHSVYDIKYRHMGYCGDDWQSVREVAIVRRAVSADHMHMLLSAPPHLSPPKLAQYRKGWSSRRLQQEP
jgi:putative transposase